MNLTTPVKQNLSPIRINPTDTILSIGSCFSEAIGQRCADYGLQTLVNPFGTIFNPLSIMKVLCMQSEDVIKQDVYSGNDCFFHFDFHSSMNGIDKTSTVESIKEKVDQVQFFLSRSDWLLITFGSSIVYRRKDNDEVVSNCHKQPSSLFTREFLTRKAMYHEIIKGVDRIREINKSIKILFTVSPVRHTKEGAIDNSRSKAALVSLVHLLLDTIPSSFYFPSYEIMMDELRDYRFYNNDLIHPSTLAVDIIWDRFVENFCATDTQEMFHLMSSILKDKKHRPFNPNSKAHLKFLSKLKEKESQLIQLFPHIDQCR